jgi:uncharacterized membrane protein HdeD (DUF308 family)
MRRWLSLEVITLIALGVYLFIIPRTEFTLLDTFIVIFALVYIVLSLVKALRRKE